MAIYDVSKLSGANDLVDSNKANMEAKGFIQIDYDGDGTKDDVWVNKTTGEVVLGNDSDKLGTISIKQINEKVGGGFLAKEVVLDDDKGAVAKVNVDVDIDKLIMDNDALEGGVAKAEVEVTGQTDALNVISDMDAQQKAIATKGTTLGVDADLTIDKGTLVFSGSNDVIFDAKKEGADGLVVNNNFDIYQKQGSTDQITVNGKVAQNIDYSGGVGQATGGGPTEWDWAWMKTFSKTSRPLDSTNSIGLEVGGTRNGKTIKDVRINAHKGVTVTYEDGTTETITLQNQGGIAVYDRSKGTLVLVADKVYTWTNPPGQGPTATATSGTSTSGTTVTGTSTSGTSTSGTTTDAKKSDPTNHFGLHGNINASTLEIEQNNKGKIGSDVGTLEWLARNEVMTDAGAVITKSNIKQSLDITVEGNGGQIKLTDTSGNWINTENVTTKDNAKVLVKGNSMTKDGLGGLSSIKDDPNAFKIETYSGGGTTTSGGTKINGDTFKDYRQLLAPDAYVRLIEKLKLLNKAADITKEDVVAAAKEVGANNLDTEQIGDLMSIIDGTGDAKINGDDINTMTIDTPTA